MLYVVMKIQMLVWKDENPVDWAGSSKCGVRGDILVAWIIGRRCLAQGKERPIFIWSTLEFPNQTPESWNNKQNENISSSLLN
jgi:hypothetical protein